MCDPYVRRSQKQRIAGYFHANPHSAELPVRRSRSASILATALLFLVQAAGPYKASAQQIVATPSGAFASGNYRNLLADRGIPKAAINARLEATFQQLFHGDPKTQAIFYAAGANPNGPLGYVTDVANHDARTERMS